MSKDHMPKGQGTPGLLDPAILLPAAGDAVRKLDPRRLLRNPVIFVTEIVAAVVTLLFLRDALLHPADAAFSGQIAVWLWFIGTLVRDFLRRRRGEFRSLSNAGLAAIAAMLAAGLFGAVVIEPPDLPSVDRSYLLVLS